MFQRAIRQILNPDLAASVCIACSFALVVVHVAKVFFYWTN